MLRLLISLFLFSACAKPRLPDVQIDPDLETYKQLFEESYNVSVSRISLIFKDDLGSNYAGLCYKQGNGFGRIEVDRGVWNQLNDSHKIVLIFHEYGHCYFNRKHNSTIKDGYPVSFMYPSIFHPPSWLLDSYIEELVTNQNQKASLDLHNDLSHDDDVLFEELN